MRDLIINRIVDAGIDEFNLNYKEQLQAMGDEELLDHALSLLKQGWVW